METQGNKIKNNANYNETLTLTGSSQETFKLDPKGPAAISVITVDNSTSGVFS